MIRINLYPSGQKPKKGKRPVLPSADEGISTGFRLMVLVGLLVILLTVVFNAAWYWKLKRDAGRIQADIQKAELDYARLTQVKLRYQEREKQVALYQRRLKVIDDLRAAQFGPVKLLTLVGDQVNRTSDIWLNSMAEDASAINIKGVALNIHSVANLMRYLQNTGYFKTVEIKSSYQDEKVNDMQAFVFELTCQKQGQTPAPPPAKKS